MYKYTSLVFHSAEFRTCSSQYSADDHNHWNYYGDRDRPRQSRFTVTYRSIHNSPRNQAVTGSITAWQMKSNEDR